MKKMLGALLVLFTFFIQCCQTGGKSENLQTAKDSSALDTISTEERVGLPKKPVYKLEKIGRDTAQEYVDNYRKWIRTKGNPISLCVTSRDTLRWLRLVKNKIANHIGIDERADLNLTNHAGIRIYPAIEFDGKQNYILVYTKILESTSGARNDDSNDIPEAHQDDLNETYLLTMNIPQTLWCKLYSQAKSGDKKVLTAHHMCEPHCGRDDAKY